MAPENILLEEDLSKVKKRLKSVRKARSLDSPLKPRKNKAPRKPAEPVIPAATNQPARPESSRYRRSTAKTAGLMLPLPN